MTQSFELYGERGWGSAIIELQLEWYGLPYVFNHTGDLLADDGARRRLQALNPLGQTPTLILPDGRLMTESAAITLYLADATGRTDLVPGQADAERAPFLRWLVFLVANIYPTFTYADDPVRFGGDDPAIAAAFCDRVLAYRQTLYRQLEEAASAPWFLGERMTAIDVYLAVMTHWRPGWKWFADHAPRLLATSSRLAAHERFADTMRRNFPAA